MKNHAATSARSFDLRQLHFRRADIGLARANRILNILMYTPKRTTWFLIADGAQMRLFESKGPKEAWRLLECKESRSARKLSHELGHERPGRGRKIGSDARFAVSNAQLHDKQEHEFVERMAKMLNKASQEDRFDQLVLAAPPNALGTMRVKIQPHVTAKYVGVFDKDLTQFSDNDLLEYFIERLDKW